MVNSTRLDAGRHAPVQVRPGIVVGEVAADNGEHLLGRRRLVFLDDRPFDGHILVGELLPLHAQAHDAPLVEQAQLAGLGLTTMCVVGELTTRLVSVPDGKGEGRPLVIAWQAQHGDVRFGSETLLAPARLRVWACSFSSEWLL